MVGGKAPSITAASALGTMVAWQEMRGEEPAQQSSASHHILLLTEWPSSIMEEYPIPPSAYDGADMRLQPTLTNGVEDQIATGNVAGANGTLILDPLPGYTPTITTFFCPSADIKFWAEGGYLRVPPPSPILGTAPNYYAQRLNFAIHLDIWTAGAPMSGTPTVSNYVASSFYEVDDAGKVTNSLAGVDQVATGAFPAFTVTYNLTVSGTIISSYTTTETVSWTLVVINIVGGFIVQTTYWHRGEAIYQDYFQLKVFDWDVLSY